MHSRCTIHFSLLPYGEEVHSVRCSLRSSALRDQFLDRRGRRLWRQRCDQSAQLFLFTSRFWREHHGFGERDVYPHADNYTGQNKNNCMMQYLVWCTITNRHTSITLSFLPVGHTKFAPDWCFGIIQTQLQKNESGKPACNSPSRQLVS